MAKVYEVYTHNFVTKTLACPLSNSNYASDASIMLKGAKQV